MVVKLVPRGSKRNGAVRSSEKVQSMTISTKRSAMPLARIVATTAVLLGATLLGSTVLVGPLSAQTTVTPPAAASDAAGARTETVEQRIVNLHEKLMITTAQEAAWASVAQVMRDNSTAIEKLIAAKKAKMPEDMTALDDLMTYQTFAQAHLDGLQKLTASFNTLYEAMPAAQKKVADQTFRDFERGSAAKRG
jgi:LTXXQ motif family protein